MAVFRYGVKYLDKFEAMGKHLTYQWELMSTFERDSIICHQTQFIQRHETYLVYGKPLMSLRARMVDVIPCGTKDKSLHGWQWAIEPAMHLVAALSEPGDLVACPCAGSGTVAEACPNLGRKHIGCDNDPAQVASWQQRFNNLSQRLYDELHDDATRRMASSRGEEHGQEKETST